MLALLLLLRLQSGALGRFVIRRIGVTSSVVMKIESDLQTTQERPAADKQYILVDLRGEQEQREISIFLSGYSSRVSAHWSRNGQYPDIDF